MDSSAADDSLDSICNVALGRIFDIYFKINQFLFVLNECRTGTGNSFTTPASAVIYAVLRFAARATQKVLWDIRQRACKFGFFFRPACPTTPDPMAFIQACYCPFNATLGPLAYNNATAACVPIANCTARTFSFF